MLGAPALTWLYGPLVVLCYSKICSTKFYFFSLITLHFSTYLSFSLVFLNFSPISLPRLPFCQVLFILISRLFCSSVLLSELEEYEIIMIIMSHFARNNTVGAKSGFAEEAGRHLLGLITSNAGSSRSRAQPTGRASFLYSRSLLFPFLSL